MEAVVPWKALIDLVEPHYPKADSKVGPPVSGNVPDQLCTPSRPKHIASLDTYGRVNPWHQAMADDIFGGMTPKGNVA
jgi:hypothetical protein